jgi:hypothetical protein
MDSVVEPRHRAISVIALIQAGVVVFGMLFVAMSLKGHGYQRGDVPDSEFKTVAIFVGRYGYTLLILPAAWAIATLATTRVPRYAKFNAPLLLLGIAAIIVGIGMFAELAISPGLL